MSECVDRESVCMRAFVCVIFRAGPQGFFRGALVGVRMMCTGYATGVRRCRGHFAGVEVWKNERWGRCGGGDLGGAETEHSLGLSKPPMCGENGGLRLLIYPTLVSKLV